MPNVIPEKEKEIIKKHYNARFLAVALLHLFLSLSLAAILLVPAYLLSVSREKLAVSRLEVLKKSVNYRKSADLENVVSEANRETDQLSDIAADGFIADILDFATRTKNPGIKLDGIGFRKTDKSRYDATVFGIARDRNSLLAYADALKAVPSFSQVDLPISNLAKDADINFSLRFRAEIK